MSAPVPIQSNFTANTQMQHYYTAGYQTEQYDQGHGADQPHGYGDRSVFDALSSPPAAGVSAQSSPDHLFEENTNPPEGANASSEIPGV